MGRYIGLEGLKTKQVIDYLNVVFKEHDLDETVKQHYIDCFSKQIKISDYEALTVFFYNNLKDHTKDFEIPGIEFDPGMWLLRVMSELLGYYYWVIASYDNVDGLDNYFPESDKSYFESECRSYIFSKTEIVNIFNWFIVFIDTYNQVYKLDPSSIPYYKLLKKHVGLWNNDDFIKCSKEEFDELGEWELKILIDLKNEIINTKFDYFYWWDSY